MVGGEWLAWVLKADIQGPRHLSLVSFFLSLWQSGYLAKAFSTLCTYPPGACGVWFGDQLGYRLADLGGEPLEELITHITYCLLPHVEQGVVLGRGRHFQAITGVNLMFRKGVGIPR